MWNAERRGIWTGTFEEFARVTGSPWEAAPRLIQELSKVATVTKRDMEVTLENRRMVREETAYKYHAKRQKDYRERHASDARVTPQTLDVRSQKSEEKPLGDASSLTAVGEKMNGHPPAFMEPIGHQKSSQVPDLIESILNAPPPSQRKVKVIRSVSEPVRKLLQCFKVMQGFKRDDSRWDQTYFKRYADEAEELLDLFEGDYRTAAMCLASLAGDFRAKELRWTMSTILKHAAEWRFKHATPEPSRPT